MGVIALNTLYEKLGGEAAVDAAVDLFYQKVLVDDRIKRFFDGVDMKRQASHQKLFLTYVFGGMQSYPGRAMRAAHQRLVDEMGLSDEHFDAVIEDLGSALRELAVSDELIAQVAATAETTRDDVLNR